MSDALALAVLDQLRGSPAALALLSPKPCTFSSLEHLDARVDEALSRMRRVNGLATTTIETRRNAYRSFRSFLKTSRSEGTFISGELSVQTRVLEEYVAHLRECGLRRATINGYWRGLRAVFEMLRMHGGLANPFLFVRAPKPGNARLSCLIPASAERVLAFVQNEASVPPSIRARNAAIVGIMLLAGLRAGEVLRLRVAHVDFQMRVIVIVDGKGPDGGKSRTVPMTRQLFALLQAYAARRDRTSGVPEFFLASRSDRALSRMTLRRVFERVSTKTGIHASPHMLRHTFCTLLSFFGVPDRLAREAMGHADAKTLQRYQHVYDGEVAAAMERLTLRIDTPTA